MSGQPSAGDARAPDYIEPIVGWRAFLVAGRPLENVCIGGPLHGKVMIAEGWPDFRMLAAAESLHVDLFGGGEAPTTIPIREERYVRARYAFGDGARIRVWVHESLQLGSLELDDLAEQVVTGARELMSPTFGAVWPRRGWLSATCRSPMVTLFGRSTVGVLHPAPAGDCSCGIYGARTAGAAADYLPASRTHWGAPWGGLWLSAVAPGLDARTGVLARVELAGKVIPGERGWRAARARVAALAVDVGLGAPGYAPEEDVRSLARAYGAEVIAADVGRLLYEARADAFRRFLNSPPRSLLLGAMPARKRRRLLAGLAQLAYDVAHSWPKRREEGENGE